MLNISLRLATRTMIAVALLACSFPAYAQTYPSRLIKLIVPFPAGTATDTEARFLADKVGTTLGQKIIVENKAGANGNLGATEAARAQPDGYTLYLATNSTHSANVHLYTKLPFDPVADFTPIARLTRNPLLFVARPPRSTDLLGGQIEFVITDVAVTREFIAAGPPGYEFAAWVGLFAPAGTPKQIVDRLNRAFTDAITSPEATRFFADVELEPDVSTPEGLAAHVKAQTELWGRIISESGLEKI